MHQRRDEQGKGAGVAWLLSCLVKKPEAAKQEHGWNE